MQAQNCVISPENSIFRLVTSLLPFLRHSLFAFVSEGSRLAEV
jgi:hypothetical protein